LNILFGYPNQNISMSIINDANNFNLWTVVAWLYIKHCIVLKCLFEGLAPVRGEPAAHLYLLKTLGFTLAKVVGLPCFAHRHALGGGQRLQGNFSTPFSRLDAIFSRFTSFDLHNFCGFIMYIMEFVSLFNEDTIDMRQYG